MSSGKPKDNWKKSGGSFNEKTGKKWAPAIRKITGNIFVYFLDIQKRRKITGNSGRPPCKESIAEYVYKPPTKVGAHPTKCVGGHLSQHVCICICIRPPMNLT